jgi:hypothetical protein
MARLAAQWQIVGVHSLDTLPTYEAIIDVAVPWDRVLSRTENPTGQAIVCCAPRTKIILCFVRPPDT